MRIDTHMHIGGEAVGFHMTEEIVLESMKKYQIDYAIVSNGDSGELDHNQNLLPESVQISQEKSLQRVLKFARNHPDKIGVGVWIKPYQEHITQSFEEFILKNLDIIYAIKLHPFHSKTAPTDKKMLPYLELAQKYHLPIVSHTGGCEEASPLHLYEAAIQYPSISFVMVHMGLGSDNKEALDLLGKAPNLYGDTTWVPMETTIEAIHRYGSKKMMFGSDAPIDGVDTYRCNPKGERSIYQDYFHVLPQKIDKESYMDLMYRNAVQVFQLNMPKILHS